MNKTKIICTLGPACNNEKTLTQMALNGMSVARLNFSHGDYSQHKFNIDLIKKVREKLGLPIPIMLDSKGPEVRIRCFKDGKIELSEGQDFTFTTKDIIGDENIVSVSFDNLINELSVGDRILLNNGLIECVVKTINKDKKEAACKVVCGGVLSDRKSMNFPGKVLSLPYLSQTDKNDFLFGIENGVDFIACSFTSNAKNLNDVRDFMVENGGGHIDLIAKIENSSGVESIDEIIKASDGIMVARGDMGVEIAYEKLPAIQKMLITTCRMKGKRVITATEMLESMITKLRPTRAEVSDVANAIYDGTSVIMLSGETAAGENPVAAVRAMRKIAEETEKNIDYATRFKSVELIIKNSVDAISHAACGVAIDVNAKVIVVSTKSGATARMVSRFRPPMPILALTSDENVWRKLSMSWGVIPVISPDLSTTDELFAESVQKAKSSQMVKSGDNIVLTAGTPVGLTGKTNLIKVDVIS